MAEDWKPRRGQKIEALWAWIAIEPDGGEGVLGAQLPGMPGVTPLIGADRERIESYRSYALGIHNLSGLPVKLVRYDGVTLVETLGDGASR